MCKTTKRAKPCSWSKPCTQTSVHRRMNKYGTSCINQFTQASQTTQQNSPWWMLSLIQIIDELRGCVFSLRLLIRCQESIFLIFMPRRSSMMLLTQVEPQLFHLKRARTSSESQALWAPFSLTSRSSILQEGKCSSLGTPAWESAFYWWLFAPLPTTATWSLHLCACS